MMDAEAVVLQDCQWHRLIQQVCGGDLWSPWLPLQRERREEALPRDQGGLYRIRVEGSDPCVYIGETGNFKRRLENELGRSLRSRTMPDGEHHTAAPGLWYLHTFAKRQLQLSLAPLTGISSAQRKGLESLAIALERRTYQRSPLLSYGRMPDGLPKPRRARSRGREDGARVDSDESVAPAGDLFDAPLQELLSSHWGGHRWSEWVPTSDLRKEKARGLYRLRYGQDTTLFVVGHGAIASAAQFQNGLTCSYIPGPWSTGQRRELLDDLIALYLLSQKDLPHAQFGDRRASPLHVQEQLPGALLARCLLRRFVNGDMWHYLPGVALAG